MVVFCYYFGCSPPPSCINRMFLRSTAIVLFLFLCLGATDAQSSSPPVKEKTHAERFSTPEVRAEKAESDATAKIAANPNDFVALNSRALARIRLGKLNEAYEDL